MAAKEREKIVKKLDFTMVHKLSASVSLLAFLVIIIAGIMAESSVTTMVLRAAVVITVVGVVSRIVIRILASYEEMNSGKA